MIRQACVLVLTMAAASLMFAQTPSASGIFLKPDPPALMLAPPMPVPPVAPDVHAERLTKVSRHVQVIPDNLVTLVPNIGFVIGSKAILVVDTGLGPKNGAVAAATALRLGGGKPIYIVTTHPHPEHDLGAVAFPASSKMIRSLDQLTYIRDQGPALNRMLASRYTYAADMMVDVPFRPADITFEKEYLLDLGGITARIVALGPNHTIGDTAVWIQKDRLLFSGDVAMEIQPILGAPIAQWMKTLDRLEQFSPKIIVPSHGPVGNVGLIRGFRTYLAEVRDRTAAARGRGLDLDAATAEVVQAMLTRYPSRDRLGIAVRVAFAEPAL